MGDSIRMCDLLDAATEGNLEKVNELLAGTKDVNFIDECGYTALHYASENGHTDVVRALLAAGAGINKIVKMLADAKCDVSMKDCNGLTAADVADKAKEADILKFLKSCSSGNVPAEAPAGKVKEERVFRTIEPVEGCGEGCAMPE